MSEHQNALIELAEVFGEDKSRVVNIRIEAPADRHIIVQIHRIPSDKEVQGLLRVFRRYELVKRGEHFKGVARGWNSRGWPRTEAEEVVAVLEMRHFLETLLKNLIVWYGWGEGRLVICSV